MAKITKPDMTYVWASGGSKTAPSNVKIQTGWIVEKPEFEKMNWVQNRQDGSLAYLFQMGVPEWDSAVEYQYSATYKSYVQRNGLVYKALQVGTNKDPASEAAYWTVAFDDKGAAAAVQSNLATHITNYGTLASLSNATTARSNLGVYSTTQVDNALALKALLAGSSSQLFSAANGTAGYEVVNKSQLDTGLATKAPVAGNSGQEFAVAAATTGNSAVNKTQFDAKTGQATETSAGITEICTNAELLAGASDAVVATPLKLRLGFAASFATNGYISFPTWLGGLVIQWGYNSNVVDIEALITFPTAFPTACYNVQCTGDALSNPDRAEIITVKNITTASFTWCGAGGNASDIIPEASKGWWLAVGK